MYYTYILQSKKDDKLYTGSTKNLKLRFEQHQNGKVESTKYRRPLKLIYYETCLVEDDARRREKVLKSYRGKMFIRRRLKSYFTGSIATVDKTICPVQLTKLTKTSTMKKLSYILPVLFILFAGAPSAEAANRYWVGGGSTSDWAATGNTNWGTASGVQDNASVPTTADDVIFDGVGTGASNASAAGNITMKSINFTGYVNTFSWSLNFSVTGGNITFSTGMTYTPSTSVALTTNGTVTLTTAGQRMGRILVSTGTLTLGDNFTKSTSETQTFEIGTTGATLNVNGKTMSGNSTADRLLIQSSTVGTATTVTVSGGTFAYADFMDINFNNGGASLDLSAITGLSGDALGNGMTGGGTLTLTASQTQYWTGNTGSWSDATQWCTSSGGCADNAGDGRTPLPQDDVVFDNGSFSGTGQTSTQAATVGTVTRSGRDISWSAYTEGQSPTWTTSGTNRFTYGSLTLISGMTFTMGGYGTSFAGRGASTLTSAGKSFTGLIGIFMPGGSLTLQDDLSGTTVSSTFTLNNGTFNANNKNVTFGNFNSSGSVTRTLLMGTGTWTLNNTAAATVWNLTTVTGLTLFATTSTIKITGTGANAQTFAGGGQTYGNLWWARTTATGNNAVSGSNTFNDFKDDGSAAHSIIFTNGTTQRFNSFNVSGSAGNVITINSATTATHALVMNGSGIVSSNYLNIQHSIATPMNKWYAGSNSVNNQSTATAGSGWIFANGPASAASQSARYKFLGGMFRFRGGNFRLW
jgi:putative endonuclease